MNTVQGRRRRTTAPAPRSRCPISLSLDVFGDRWTLLILRDVIFADRRHFREFLEAEEGISSNILADRLQMLVAQEILTRTDDPTHKQKAIYSLTERGIQLVPVLATIGAWGRHWQPVTRASSREAQRLEEGGPKAWEALMTKLRSSHLGLDAQRTAGSVR